MAFYIESGTGRQISDLSQIDPSKTYIESGTGRQISGVTLKPTSTVPIGTTGSTSFGAVNTQPSTTSTTSSNWWEEAEKQRLLRLEQERQQAIIAKAQSLNTPERQNELSLYLNSLPPKDRQLFSPTQGKTAVTLGNGAVVYYDRNGQAYDAIGNKVSNEVIARSTAKLTPATTAQSNDLNSIMEEYIKKMEAAGMMINPNVTIDAATLQEFATLAAKEIDPYYAEQLRTSVSDFLLEQGISKDKLLENEKRLSAKYGTATRQIGEQAAEQGFAQSGLRVRDERDLATDVQQQVNDQRLAFQQNQTKNARDLEKVFGTGSVPGFSLGNRPTVGAGERGFGTSPDSPLYNISESLYGGITGSNVFQQRADKRTRQSQLAEGYRSGQSLDQIRSLTL